VKTYTVKRGDTLEKIATKYNIAPTTIWWANKLQTTELTEGDLLRVPQVDGLIVDVEATDTLDGIATRYGVDGSKILETNGLHDPNLVVGQVIVVPGAKGDAMPVEKPDPAPAQKGGGSKARDDSSPGAADPGGKFVWPVVGGDNYVSQYFHYGHYAIDIAADHGSTVRAATGGTVTFAGWKSNGGGYQVWISHGSGLFTTYNHMSSITVGVGQKVERGEQVGRVGQSGRATGPHLHFEVWRGAVWDGGQRINPMGYF
jgi:murein DD-endopeptidase MepM/ murein hydrolase activator NlpD